MRAHLKIDSLVLAVVLIASAACAPQPAASPTPPVETPSLPTSTPVARSTELPTTATANPTVGAAATRVALATSTPEATATTAPGAPTPAPPIEAGTDNIWAVVLAPASAPSDWTVRPCEGDGPFLCVSKGGEEIGAAQLSIYPVETMTDFQRMLADAGVAAGQANVNDPQQMRAVLEALGSFVEAYHASMESDRQGEYGDRIRYARLNTEQLTAGPLPALRYGFTGINGDATIFERWVSYVAFDGDLMYIVVAPYRPGAIPTFQSDEELAEFLPSLTEIVANLRLPLPVTATTVTSARALRPLDIFRAYGGEAGNPVGRIAAGETVAVTGVSPTGRHWRVGCPSPDQRSCWIAGTSDDTEPEARQR